MQTHPTHLIPLLCFCLGNFVLLLYLDTVTINRIQSSLKLLLGYGTLPALHIFSTGEE